MLEIALNFFMSKKCYLCGKTIDKNDFKFMCTSCFNKLKMLEKDYYKIEKRNNVLVEYLFIFEYKYYIRKLILSYKFFNKPYLGKVFSEIIIKNKKICQKIKSYDIIIPVPMSKEGKKKRGYNQTEIISKIISQNIGIKYNKNILLKSKNIKRQSLLDRKERLINVKNAYMVNNKFEEYLFDKKIIIFDDIYTTGATINECLNITALKGVKEILVVILAKD